MFDAEIDQISIDYEFENPNLEENYERKKSGKRYFFISVYSRNCPSNPYIRATIKML